MATKKHSQLLFTQHRRSRILRTSRCRSSKKVNFREHHFEVLHPRLAPARRTKVVPTRHLHYIGHVQESPKSVLNVEAAMVARAVRGALLIAIIAAIIVTLLSLVMFLREPIYEPTARVWVERDLRFRPPSPGPHKRLTETTPAMVRLAASRSVAKEAKRSLGLQASSAELLDNSKIRQVKGTTFIELTYRDTDRKKATQTVNTLARVASERLSEAGNKNLTAVVWKEAQVPPAVPEPKPLRNGLLTLVGVWALYAGLTLAMVAVLRRGRSPTYRGD